MTSAFFSASRTTCQSSDGGRQAQTAKQSAHGKLSRSEEPTDPAEGKRYNLALGSKPLGLIHVRKKAYGIGTKSFENPCRVFFVCVCVVVWVVFNCKSTKHFDHCF